MGEIIIKNGAAISLGSIDGEEDLKPKPGLININPPPQDGECDCCGRHISEFKPFGKAGDPLVGDFDGALLVKTWRPYGPPPPKKVSEIYDELFEVYKDHEEMEKMLIKEYGEEEGKNIMFAVEFHDCVGSCWLCRDCIVLDPVKYFEKQGANLDEFYSWEPMKKYEGKASDVQE